MKSIGAWAGLAGRMDLLDYTARAALVLWCGWSGYLACAQISGLLERAQETGMTIDLGAEMASRLAIGVFMAFIACLTLVRHRAAAKAPGFLPRFIAVAGTYLLLTVAMFSQSSASAGQHLLSASLVALGSAAAAYCAFRLGRSISIMPEARRLVTDGPYALVRHPLYVAEEVAILGLFVEFASLSTAMLVCIHLALQFQRMRYEEAVLGATFPEYADYAARTPAFIPRLIRSRRLARA